MVDASTIGVIQALYGVGPNGGIPTALVTDKTLTLENRAADAKAAGDAIRAVTNTANTLSARANVLSGSVSGSSITATDSFAAPFVGLRVCGKSTQDGTPTPTTPVPIVSAGDGGTVAVTVSDGANESQMLTLQTPNALPGIPVTSGGNYTDENGQQWVCDEIDLERGVRVQRVGSYTFQNVDISVVGENTYRISYADEVTKKASGTVYSLLCTAYTNNHKSQWASNACPISWSGEPYRQLRVYDTREQAEVLESLNSGNVRIDYVLSEPVETMLTDAELAAYKALTTYAPTTTISVSGSAGATASYQRDVNIVIKNLEDAIASMTQN